MSENKERINNLSIDEKLEVANVEIGMLIILRTKILLLQQNVFLLLCDIVLRKLIPIRECVDGFVVNKLSIEEYKTSGRLR